MLSKKKNHITTIVAIHLALLQQFSGINAVVTYGGEIAGQTLPNLEDILPSLINL
jgi:MFS family permease